VPNRGAHPRTSLSGVSEQRQHMGRLSGSPRNHHAAAPEIAYHWPACETRAPADRISAHISGCSELATYAFRHRLSPIPQNSVHEWGTLLKHPDRRPRSFVPLRSFRGAGATPCGRKHHLAFAFLNIQTPLNSVTSGRSTSDASLLSTFRSIFSTSALRCQRKPLQKQICVFRAAGSGFPHNMSSS
jgi:hypothetical protein